MNQRRRIESDEEDAEKVEEAREEQTLNLRKEKEE